MFIAYSSADICKVDKGWIPDLSPTYYGDNNRGYPKWGLKRKKNKQKKPPKHIGRVKIDRGGGSI